MRLTIPRVEARGKYEIVGNVLLLPVRSNGEFWAEFTDITAVIKVYGKETTRENIAYMHIEKLGLDFTMKNARFKVKDNINSQNVLGKIRKLLYSRRSFKYFFDTDVIIIIFFTRRRSHQPIFKYKCQRFGARNETGSFPEYWSFVQENFEFSIWQYTDAAMAPCLDHMTQMYFYLPVSSKLCIMRIIIHFGSQDQQKLERPVHFMSRKIIQKL